MDFRLRTGIDDVILCSSIPKLSSSNGKQKEGDGGGGSFGYALSHWRKKGFET